MSDGAGGAESSQHGAAVVCMPERKKQQNIMVIM
jgi:hypothetical protein